MNMLPLFEERPPGGFDREGLAAKLAELAAENILIGTSSWKYEGWLGQIYSESRYVVRGKFSKKRFEQTALAEYAETFPIVCGDFAFYQFPAPEFWNTLFATAPPSFKFAFKVPEEITCKTFPTHPRYGPRAGERNDTFLHAALFEEAFLAPLEPYRERIPLLIFEFGAFSRRGYAEPAQFFEDLDAFLSALPTTWHYAVEIRNEDYLRHGYFEALRRNSVAHVFNAWARMPPIHRQVEIAEAFTADFTVVRGLLRVGRAYEKAVEQFAPYDRIQDPNPPFRETVKGIINHAKKRKQAAYLFINNRLEGNAPVTIQSIVSLTSMTRDHVCDREVDEKTAPAKCDYAGDTYYFHSEECKKRFESDPEAFVSRAETSQT
ncbi:MAG: DUF72 domain-containing protein [Bryobacteraceae bacterium]|nr:DUF72 domain-containing protein [Bryobacteraceae bacterium]